MKTSLLRCAALTMAVSCTPAEEPDIDLGADPDGDGLSTGEELAGYEILIDETGVWDRVNGRVDDPRSVVHVTSDPLVADTDGDGLTDLEERAWATDPSRADTDGDGLSDIDELRRWETSPTSVDTDGDATGGTNSGTTSPLPALFDGAELQLELVDGLWQAGPVATSPILVDTDGDGASDYYEHISPTRSGVIPDRPRFDINVTPGTTIALDLNVEWGEGLENSQSYQTTQFDSARDSETKFTSAVGGFHASMEEWIGLKVGVSAEVGLTGMSATVDTTVYGGIDVTAGAHGTATTGTGESGRRESRRTLAEVRDAGRTRNQRVSGGRIAATFDVVNTGNLAFTLTDLSLGVTRWDTNTRSTKPLTTLQAGNAQATLAPGERTTVFFEDDDLPADRVMDVMADPSSLSFTPVAFGIERSEGVDLDFVDEDILLRTAHVVISYADGTSDVFDRASDVRRDALGNPIGLTIREILAEVGIPAVSRDTPSGVIVYDINSIPSTEYTEDPEPLPYAAEERWLETGWFVLLHRDGRNGELPDDRLDTPLRAGDQATLVQIMDLDRDGLTSWHEAQYGTSDLAVDSDGDGHSDVKELFVEHLIGEDPDNPGTLIYGHSDPAAVDSDGDGLSDDEELNWCLPVFFGWQFCLNPLDADTDGDGIDDFTEVRDWLESPWDAVNVNFITPPSAECVYTRVTQNVDGVDFECRHTQLIISDPGFDLIEVRASFGRRPWREFDPRYGLWLDVPGSEISAEYAPMDVSVTGFLTLEDLLTPEHLAIMRAPQSCEQVGGVSVKVEDYTGLTAEVTCSWGGVW